MIWRPWRELRDLQGQLILADEEIDRLTEDNRHLYQQNLRLEEDIKRFRSRLPHLADEVQWDGVPYRPYVVPPQIEEAT